MNAARALEADRGEGIDRRRCLLALLPVSAAFVPFAARAGAQVEEPLTIAVRLALNAAIEFRGSETRQEAWEFPTSEAYIAHLRWLIEMNHRLRRRGTDLQTTMERKEFLEAVWYESKRRSFEPKLVLGLIQVESGFRKNVFSIAGAMGYMQVMPFWTRLIGNGDVGKLYNTRVNLRFGCEILWHYLTLEGGNLFMALGRYNGSRGKPAYPQAVLAAAKQWEFNPS